MMATLTLRKSTPRVEAIRKEAQRTDIQKMDDLTWQWMRKNYPHLFKNLNQPRLLAINIHRDLQEASPASISNKSVCRVVSRLCRRKQYLKALAAGGKRHGLTGPSGAVTPEQQAKADGSI